MISYQRTLKTFINYSFTATIEDQLDLIAKGKLNWVSMIDSFYKKFHKEVEAKAKSEKNNFSQPIGEDPVSKETIHIKYGRYGYFLQKGDATNKNFATIPKNIDIQSLTLEKAIQFFNLPREMGTYEDEKIILNEGRYGPYIKHGEKYISLAKNYDIFSIQLSDIKTIIESQKIMFREIGMYEGKIYDANKGKIWTLY